MLDELENYVLKDGLLPLDQRGSVAASVVEEEAHPLWGDRHVDRVPHVLQKENARHRVMLELKATGKYTNKEIGELLDMSPVTVNYVLRQPWAERLLVELIRKEGATEREAVFRLLDGVCLEAVTKQIDLLRSSKNEDVVRKVSNDLLNRTYGTPTATVKTVSASDLKDLSDAEIAQQLAEIRAQRPSN